MSLKTTNRQVIREVPWGMLVWQLPTGEFLTDDEGNFMHVFCSDLNKERLRAAKEALTDAAKHYGFPEGKAIFWGGRRPITDEQLEEQLARANAGLVPDPLDLAAITDEAKALRQEK